MSVEKRKKNNNEKQVGGKIEIEVKNGICVTFKINHYLFLNYLYFLNYSKYSSILIFDASSLIYLRTSSKNKSTT